VYNVEMRSLRHSLALIPALALAACGGGSSGDDGDDANTIDAARTIDSNNAPDGTPAPDAQPGAWDCIGDPFPTTAASDPITINGVTNEINQNGQVALGGVTVEAFDNGDNSLGSTTSDATTAAYTLSVATGGDPVDGYLEGSTTATGYKQLTYVYPPQPLANDQASVPVLMVSNTTWAFLPLLSDGATQSNTNGLVGVLVVDCLGNPVSGASVTVPGAQAIRYVAGTGIGDHTVTTTDASGIALAFDVPPGNVQVDATTTDHAFYEHTILVRGGVAGGSGHGVITTTVVAPGPITGLAP
jgi:hypothetical protein